MSERKTATAKSVEIELKALATPERAAGAQRYFKTGKGEYGHGDVFCGVTVPDQRAVAKKYRDLPLSELEKLLQNKIHECRLTALFILVGQFRKADEAGQKNIVDLYLRNKKYVNNWDLVDSSAGYILGNFLKNKSRKILYKLAVSKNVWHRRIAIISTQSFIRDGDFKDTLEIAKMLMKDEHDLIHKASGWMLREVGDKSNPSLVAFLENHASEMPRTMLRYSIEKLPPSFRKKFLAK